MLASPIVVSSYDKTPIQSNHLCRSILVSSGADFALFLYGKKYLEQIVAYTEQC